MSLATALLVVMSCLVLCSLGATQAWDKMSFLAPWLRLWERMKINPDGWTKEYIKIMGKHLPEWYTVSVIHRLPEAKGKAEYRKYSATVKNEELCPVVSIRSNCMTRIAFLTLSVVLIGLNLFLKTYSIFPFPISFPLWRCHSINSLPSEILGQEAKKSIEPDPHWYKLI